MATHPEPSSHTSPNKRFKTLGETPYPPSFVSKGKSQIQLPIQNEVESESTDCCGICLSEVVNGGIIRGYIDSCNHYFCFVCIVEWAKVGSRCPFCKRRFSTIRRPPKPPIFTSERLVQVPVRDQVVKISLSPTFSYAQIFLIGLSLFWNATISRSDPYSEVNCSVCHNTADENLLLLCDLCDAASHTYCVGLGDTVPEGDWFCHDCTLLRDYSTTEAITASGIQTSIGTAHEPSSANEHFSVYDIVREPDGSAFQRSKESVSSDPCHLPTTGMIKNLDGPISRSLEIVTKNPTQPNARTLQHCRDLHDRIRLLRENWNGFQNGVLHFSSPCDVKISSQKSEVQCSSSVVTKGIGTREIHRAWKMMDKAKSNRQGRQRSTISVHRASEYPVRKLCALKNAEYSSCRHLLPDISQQNASKNVESMVQGNYSYHSPEKDHYEQVHSVSGKQKWTSHSPTQAVQTSSYQYDASVRSEKLPAEKSVKGPAILSSSVVTEPVVLNVGHAKEARHTKEKSELTNICVDRQQYDNAKSVLQTLVKLNLKLQTKEEKSGVDAFKEVARQATHSILAACGLEQPKPGSCSIPGFICSHPDEIRLLRRSSLMPNSCRECFYVFVKDMVNNTVVVFQKRSRRNI